MVPNFLEGPCTCGHDYLSRPGLVHTMLHNSDLIEALQVPGSGEQAGGGVPGNLLQSFNGTFQ